MDDQRSGAVVQSDQHPAGYYAQARPEVADLVPTACRRVLDVGCGCGRLGRLLKERGHHVTGIELQPAAAEEARQWLDRVETCDIEAEDWPFAPQSFDALVFAD